MTRDLFLVEQTDNAMVLIPAHDLGDLKFHELQVDGDRLLTKYADSPNHPHVIVDFSRTTYFGSSTINMMLRLWKQVSAAGGQMLLCSMSDDELEILTVVQLDQLWPVCDTREEAIARLSEGD